MATNDTKTAELIAAKLQQWTEQARRDDWHTTFVGSDIRMMLGEITRSRTALAAKEAEFDRLRTMLRPILNAAESRGPDGILAGVTLGECRRIAALSAPTPRNLHEERMDCYQFGSTPREPATAGVSLGERLASRLRCSVHKIVSEYVNDKGVFVTALYAVQLTSADLDLIISALCGNRPATTAARAAGIKGE